MRQSSFKHSSFVYSKSQRDCHKTVCRKQKHLFTALHNLLQGYTTCYRVTQLVPVLHNLLQGYTTCYSVTQLVTALHNLLQSYTTCYRVTYPVTGLHNLGQKKLIICFSGTARVTFNPPASTIFITFSVFTLKNRLYIANCQFRSAVICRLVC